MEQRTKRNLAIIKLVADFEMKVDDGDLHFIKEDAFNQIIHYYTEELQIDKALEVADLAINQYNFRSEFYITKAKLLIQANKLDIALATLEKAENIAPYELDILLLKSKIYAYSGLITESTNILDEVKAYSTDGDLSDIFLYESFIHEVSHDYNAMYNSLKQSLDFDPHNKESLDRILLSIELTKEYEDGIVFHKRLIDRNSYNHLAWYNLGNSYACLGEYDKAIEALEFAFIVKNDFEFAYLEAADFCIQIQWYKKALDIYQEYVRIFGLNEDVLLNLAECYYELNQLAKAKYHLQKAIKTDPYSDEVYYKLAQCYAKEANWHMAINAYHKAIAIEDSLEEYYHGLAVAYFELGTYDKADFFYKKATLRGPEETIYWSSYASFLIKTGKYNDALELLEQAEEFTFGADLLYCKGTALLKLANKKLAYDVFEEAILEDYDCHKIIFEIEPELALDNELQALIKYFELEI